LIIDLYEVKVWYAAVGQCFFSLGTGFGTIVMFSSYNPFRHNVYKLVPNFQSMYLTVPNKIFENDFILNGINRDALIISLMDTFTSLLAGCTIFAVIGYLAQESKTDISKVTEGGTGLAFISYPEAISQFTWAPQVTWT